MHNLILSILSTLFEIFTECGETDHGLTFVLQLIWIVNFTEPVNKKAPAVGAFFVTTLFFFYRQSMLQKVMF